MADTSRVTNPPRTYIFVQNAAPKAGQTPQTTPKVEKDTFKADALTPKEWPAAFRVDQTKKLSPETIAALEQFFKRDKASFSIFLSTKGGDGQESIEITKDVFKKLQGHPIVMTGQLSYVEFEFSSKEPFFKPDELVRFAKPPNTAPAGKISVGGYATFPDKEPVQLDLLQKTWPESYQVFFSFQFDENAFGSAGKEIGVPLKFSKAEAASKGVTVRLGMDELNDLLRFNFKKSEAPPKPAVKPAPGTKIL